MRKSWLSQSGSLLRVPKGVKRFLSNVANEMRERVAIGTDSDRAFSDAQTLQDFKEPEPDVVPEAIRSAEQEQEQLQEERARQIERWRQQIHTRIANREQNRIFFADMKSEAIARYHERLREAQAQVAKVSEGLKSHTDANLTESPAVAAVEQSPATTVSAPSNLAVAAEASLAVAQPAIDSSAVEAPEPIAICDLENYVLPDINLLEAPDLSNAQFVDDAEIERQKRILQDTLDSFAVDAFVYDAIVGPRITQFRVQPGTGVRVESIASLERNICLALASTSIRIQAPIPGEPFVGIEVGNRNAFPVRLQAMLASKVWELQQHEIPLVLGMDIQGKIVLTDLNKAPHLLIAGATGSGKSVCMSNLVLSLLYHFRPDQLEMVMIDPKRVEFGMFKGIPHLIHPVVTEPKMAVQVLKWVVKEMERRYEVLAAQRVRNIAGYNAKAAQGDFPPMPFMVVIIDELADLMMTSKGEAEEALARIAQLSRAVGIHTIIATQRPSVNVITGVIKANYPTRIAFQVSSQIDSRTILDSKGAESLLGQGDMLFNPPGIARLVRIQSPYVDDSEILRVVESVARFGKLPDRVDLASVAPAGESGATAHNVEDDADDDEQLIRKAIQIIAQSQKASTSYLQRRLRIGYNRAATLMEELEDRGHVGPQIGTTPREIFINAEENAFR